MGHDREPGRVTAEGTEAVDSRFLHPGCCEAAEEGAQRNGIQVIRMSGVSLPGGDPCSFLPFSLAETSRSFPVVVSMPCVRRLRGCRVWPRTIGCEWRHCVPTHRRWVGRLRGLRQRTWPAAQG